MHIPAAHEHVLWKRDPSISVSAETVFATPTAQPASNVSSSNSQLTTALIAVLVVFSTLILLGTLYCVVKHWKFRRSLASSALHNKVISEKSQGFGPQPLTLNESGLEKPKPVYHLAPPIPFNALADQHAGWVPQIRTIRGVPVQHLKSASTDKSSFHLKSASTDKSSFHLESPSSDNSSRHLKSDSTNKGLFGLGDSEKSEKSVFTLTPQLTPPPTYIVANGGLPTPATPPAPYSPPSSGTLYSPPISPPSKESNPNELTIPKDSKPIPSPARNDSFAYQQAKYSPVSMSPTKSNPFLKLPRLMSVIGTFERTMDDELPITIGDTIRVLEEYRDGWCLAQLVGKMDSPKGVVPRQCLSERQATIPMGRVILSGGRPHGW